MSLLQMSFSGAVLILVIVIIRAILINKLSKRTFLILWGIAILRLLIPFSIPSALSVYSFFNQYTIINAFDKTLIDNNAFDRITTGNSTFDKVLTDNISSDEAQANTIFDETSADNTMFDKAPADSIIHDTNEKDFKSVNKSKGFPTNILYEIPYIFVWTIIWFTGMVTCAVFFIISYVRCSFEFKTSFPVQNDFVEQWLRMHQIKRPISIRQSDRISSPLTYGIFRPVILMPKNTDWENINQLQYILLHEYVHICHYDIIIKLILTFALCIHWFNPFVWVMYILFNRDIELACDESVIYQFGEKSKTFYANMLVNMEAKKSGLMPFSNSFSKNAIEERIKAIMKIRKASLFTVVISIILVIFVTTTFATSAANNNESSENNSEKTGSMSDTNFSKEKDERKEFPTTDFESSEYKKLLALQFDGYEDMSISEYQSKVWRLTDTKDYRDLLERFSKDNTLYEMKDDNEIASFLFNILEPFTAEKWQVREFGGYTTTNYPSSSDNAVFEFVYILTINNKDMLTVGEYDNTRLEIKEKLQTILDDKTEDELQNEELMQEMLSVEINDIIEKYSSDKLKIDIEYSFMPLMDYDEATWDNIQQEWDKALAPYIPFGLSYNYDLSTDDYKMYYKGREVKGIYDETAEVWITAHSGIGAAVYDDNAVELYAVYEEGKLVGIRESTAEEQRELTRQRQQTTDEGTKINELQYSNEILFEEKEERRYPNGTAEDYGSLLALMVPDYQNMSVVDFNMSLLEWANENYERMERIYGDILCNDFQVSLSDDEISFIKWAVYLSGMENGKYVQSNYTGRPKEDPVYSQYLPEKADKRNGRIAWCDLYYQFSYHIENKETLTIGERDRLIRDVVYGIQEFWNETDIEDMLKMNEDDVVEKLSEIVEKYSNSSLTITIRNDYVSFESMDERGIN